jgi:branched-chain amino acid transport system substrate-binding protein
MLPTSLHAGRALRAAGICALPLLAACQERASGEVVLGVAAPLQEEYGRSVRQGAELAMRELNAAGARIRLDFKDDRRDAGHAIAVAKELADDPRVVAVVGHNNSGTTLSAAPVYSAGRVPAVAISATSPSISRLGPWIFRVASSDSSNAVELARVAAAEGRSIAILYANDDYGQALTRDFTAALGAAGRRVVQSDPYLEDMKDFRPYLRRLKARGVDLVFLAGSEQGATTLVPQAREVGLDARFLGGDGIEGLAGRGAMYDGTRIGVLFHADASPEARRFAQAYRGAYGRSPDSSAALAYDAVRLVARAAAEAGADREKIRGYLERVGAPGGAPAFVGVAGEVRFDAHGDPVGKPFVVGVARAGQVALDAAAPAAR